ncbi:MAG: hypothetical protein RIT24_516, partial [Planctomycetota bacterium]
MKTKTLGVVIGIAAVSIAGAYVALSRGTKTAEFEPGGVFLEGFEAKAGSVDRIELERGGKKVEVVREGGAWKLAS